MHHGGAANPSGSPKTSHRTAKSRKTTGTGGVSAGRHLGKASASKMTALPPKWQRWSRTAGQCRGATSTPEGASLSRTWQRCSTSLVEARPWWAQPRRDCRPADRKCWGSPGGTGTGSGGVVKGPHNGVREASREALGRWGL